jgi:hypothetical protein
MSELVHGYVLVRLTSDDYSVPKGSIGVVQDECEHMPDFYKVEWPEEGVSSVPVAGADLKKLGWFHVPVRDRTMEKRLVSTIRELDNMPRTTTLSGRLLARLRARRANREQELNARRRQAGLDPVTLEPEDTP